MVVGLHIVQPTDAHRAVVRAVAPLAADLSIRCAVLRTRRDVRCPAGAELGSSASSDALRRFLEHNPWDGMGSVTKQDWLFLAGDDHTLVFGRRRGAVGIGAVVVMVETSGGFEPIGLQGWSLEFADPGQSAGVVDSAVARGSTVTVTWECGAVGVPGAWQAAQVIVRVEIFETSTEAHFLLVCEPNPALPSDSVGMVGDVGAVMGRAVPSRRCCSWSLRVRLQRCLRSGSVQAVL